MRALITAIIMSGAAQAEQLTAIRDTYPSPSPDATALVFQSNRSGTNEIWRMGRDGNQLVQLTHSAGAGSESPVWSPDGQWVVFARYVADGNNEVFIMKPDGSGQQRLTHSPGYDGHPHWSADSRRIVFNSDRNSPDLSVPWGERWHDIYIMNIDGSELSQLTDCRGICTYGSISPDGKQVAYRHSIDEPGLNWALGSTDRNSEVFVAALDGTGKRNLSNSTAFDGWPIWSPDGQWIAFASNRAGPPRVGQIWLIRPDGSQLTQTSKGALGHVQPAWMGNDTLLAYRFYESASEEFGGLAVVELSGVDDAPKH
ncbi:MAG: hypothetical protein DHS20C11_03760 [Lysobacteraceae bacterium]|nr:MAG: hypothetical protein DHS20C11_03760 [Xanthomonadaceae bacterium]